MIELHFLLIVLQLAYGRYGEVETYSGQELGGAMKAVRKASTEAVAEQSVRNDGVG